MPLCGGLDIPFQEQQFEAVRNFECEAELDFLAGTALKDRSLDQGQPGVRLDPVRLFELARLNKMLNFLPSRPDDLPAGCEELGPKVDHARLYTLALNRQGVSAAIQVSQRLDEAGIAHIHIKGPLQQQALYGCYFQKPCADMDILIRPQSRRRATNLLKADGFVQLDGHIAFWWRTFLGEIHLRKADGGAMVDLHHALQQSGLPRPRRIADFFEQCGQITFDGREFLVPNPVHRVLIAAISLSKAFLAREPALSSLIDLHMGLAQLGADDMDRLEQNARSLGLDLTLGLALHMLSAYSPRSAKLLPEVARPLPSLRASHLRKMVATPWVENLPWPRRRKLMSELCGQDMLRYTRETVRSGMSETIRKSLEHIAARRGIAR